MGTPTGAPVCQICRNAHAQFRGNHKFSFSRCGQSVKTDILTTREKVTTTEKDGEPKWGKNQFSQL